jgi:hypothetical protein
MIPLLLESLHASNPAPKPSVVTGARRLEQLEGVELALIEARSRILSALDCELEAVRAMKARPTNGSGVSPEVFQQSPLPANVLTLNREIFAPKEQLPPEAALDPALERATIEELNAALAAAFSQVSES